MIEDDAHAALLLKEASREEDGLAYLERARPDRVVLDVRLPAMNGTAVLRHIRATYPALPVNIVTSAGTLGEIDEARRLGVTEIIEEQQI